MRNVAVIIFPGVQALDVAGPLDVFAEANRFVGREAGYATTILGTEPGPFRAMNGMQIVPDKVFSDASERYDMILFAGGPLLPSRPVDPILMQWLVENAHKCERYGSICNGAFALGHAGLLDGKSVATHWQDAPLLAEKFPRARVEPDRIYLRDGKLVTSAGVTAGIDLSLALVAEDHGKDVALQVAKRLVVFTQRQGGQSQFSPYLTVPPDDASAVAKIQTYVMEHHAEKFTVKQLARVVGMSARNFARVFVQEAKMTPGEFVERARIDAARNLLERGDMVLKAVAHHCGFGSPDRMRIVFAKHLGMTPTQYRGNFQ
jgi:transcriptional regulator GlxA family with amidase domain